MRVSPCTRAVMRQEGVGMSEHGPVDMPFAKVYPMEVQKAQRKHRTSAVTFDHTVVAEHRPGSSSMEAYG